MGTQPGRLAPVGVSHRGHLYQMQQSVWAAPGFDDAPALVGMVLHRERLTPADSGSALSSMRASRHVG
jgi:hypothetical protein